MPCKLDPTWTRSPSAAAIATAEALPADLPYAERRARVHDIFAASEPEGDRFRPFSRGERARLRAAYDDDLERIARDYPDAMMAFSQRELAV